jgi:hypothetical protein
MGEWENGEMLDSVAESQCGGETVKPNDSGFLIPDF